MPLAAVRFSQGTRGHMNSITDDEPQHTGFGGINWGLVAAVLTIIGWALAAASGAFGDYRKIGDRVTVLETQRANDTQRQERIENKVDRILERLQK
jgi:hypothetical protein